MVWRRSTLSGTRPLGSTQPSLADISVLLMVRDSIYQAKRRTKSTPAVRHVTNHCQESIRTHSPVAGTFYGQGRGSTRTQTQDLMLSPTKGFYRRITSCGVLRKFPLDKTPSVPLNDCVTFSYDTGLLSSHIWG